MIRELLHVCFVSHTGELGGAERSLLELVDALRGSVECRVIVPCRGPLSRELEARGVQVVTLPFRGWMGRSSPVWQRALRTLVDVGLAVVAAARMTRWNCDLVYTNTITVSVGALAARLLRRPHVWHIHEFGYDDHGLTFDLTWRLSTWLIGRLSAVCIVNSRAVFDEFARRIPADKLKVIYYSVTIPPAPPAEPRLHDLPPAARIRCATVGTLQAGKGHHEAIRAVAELVRNGVGAELSIVGRPGDPRYAEHLEHLIAELGLEAHVRRLGYLDDVFRALVDTDVLLMCSRREAFGRVTVEAMRAGKPVIGARSGGTVELVREGFNGLLYTAGDHRELATRIEYLAQHPDVGQTLGENGRRWAAQQFTQERYGSEVLDALRQALGRTVSRRIARHSSSNARPSDGPGSA